MPWLRSNEQEPLTVSMAGVRLGDRLLVIGGSDPQLLAGVAAKTGLTGRACLVEESEARATAAAAAAERDGALVEAFTAPWTSLPFREPQFDVVIVRHVLPQVSESLHPAIMGEAHRVLRPGGRALVIDGTERKGLQGLVQRLAGGDGARMTRAAVAALEAARFRAVRTLAERAGLIFVEGVRANE